MKDFFIFGAGSAGLHHAHACVGLGFSVHVYDSDTKALERFKAVYIDRYKCFNDRIKRSSAIPNHFGYVIIATPPDSHLSIIKNLVPFRKKGILVEKPIFVSGGLREFLALPDAVSVNYNHLASHGFKALLNSIKDKAVLRVSVNWLESEQLLKAAHPWIKDQTQYYLNYTSLGGGCAHEHSHGLAAAVKIIRFKNERVVKTQNYKAGPKVKDINFQVDLITDRFKVTVCQDFISKPAAKNITVILKDGIKQCLSFEKNEDILSSHGHFGEISKVRFPKDRTIDFELGILAFIDEVDKQNFETQAIALEVMKIIHEVLG